MARQPINVLVFPFRKNADGEYEYAIFKRSDEGFWQGISGGVDYGETIEMSARREALEEAGPSMDGSLHKLDSITSVPAHLYKASKEWGQNVYVLPQHYFAMEVTDPSITISREHSEYKWALYEEAMELLYWHSDKTGLQELNSRLINRDLS